MAQRRTPPLMITPADAATILAQGSTADRLALASDHAAPPEALYYLMSDPSAAIRCAVAANPATPYQSFLTLAEDEDPAVRAALATRLATLAPELGPMQRHRLAETAWAALARLAEDQLEEIRAIIAEAVKDLPQAPRQLILTLAYDRAIRIAEPVIRLSPLLTEEDLLALVAAPPLAETLIAIARRPGISEAVADALVATGDEAAITALIANPSAAIRESTLDALVVQAAERIAWQEALVRRPALTPRAALTLAAFIAEHLLAELCQRASLSPAAITHLRRIVAHRLGAQPLPGETPADAAHRAAFLLDHAALDEALLRRAVQAADGAFVITALAGLTRVTEEDIRRAITARCTKTLAGLCHNAGLGPETTQQVINLLIPPFPLAPGPEPSPSLSPPELEWRLTALRRTAPPS